LTGIGYSMPSSISQTVVWNVVPERKSPKKTTKTKKDTTEKLPGIGLSLMFV